MRSNSFRSDYRISGGTLAEAIETGIGRICRDILPRSGGWYPLSARAEWRGDIMHGCGGVELVVTAAPHDGGATSTYPAWVEALPSDIREAIDLRIVQTA